MGGCASAPRTVHELERDQKPVTSNRQNSTASNITVNEKNKISTSTPSGRSTENKENPEYLPGSPPDSGSAWVDSLNGPIDLSAITGRSEKGAGDFSNLSASGVSTSGKENSGSNHRPILPAHVHGTRPPAASIYTHMSESMHGTVTIKIAGLPDGMMQAGGFAGRDRDAHLGAASARGAGGFGGAGGEASSSVHGGVVPMGSSSMHAGLMMGAAGGGSTNGGPGTGSNARGNTAGPFAGNSQRGGTLAQRALYAARFRESKSAMERHKVTITGTGKEILLFSHSFGSNQWEWQNVLDAFDLEEFKIITFDLIGALKSDYDAFDFQRYSTLHGFATDLLDLMAELGIEGSEWGQQCTFIGHQQSGIIGLLAAIDKPSFFKRVITISSSPRYLSAPDFPSCFELNDLDQVFGIMQGNFRMWTSSCAPILTADDIKVPTVREFCRPLFLLRSDVGFSKLKTIFVCDVRDLLPKITVPVSALFIANDPFIPTSVMQHMSKAIVNSTSEILNIRSFQRHPDVVASAILRHLRGDAWMGGEGGGRKGEEQGTVELGAAAPGGGLTQAGPSQSETGSDGFANSATATVPPGMYPGPIQRISSNNAHPNWNAGDQNRVPDPKLGPPSNMTWDPNLGGLPNPTVPNINQGQAFPGFPNQAYQSTPVPYNSFHLPNNVPVGAAVPNLNPGLNPNMNPIQGSNPNLQPYSSYHQGSVGMTGAAPGAQRTGGSDKVMGGVKENAVPSHSAATQFMSLQGQIRTTNQNNNNNNDNNNGISNNKINYVGASSALEHKSSSNSSYLEFENDSLEVDII